MEHHYDATTRFQTCLVCKDMARMENGSDRQIDESHVNYYHDFVKYNNKKRKRNARKHTKKKRSSGTRSRSSRSRSRNSSH